MPFDKKKHVTLTYQQKQSENSGLLANFVFNISRVMRFDTAESKIVFFLMASSVITLMTPPVVASSKAQFAGKTSHTFARLAPQSIQQSAVVLANSMALTIWGRAYRGIPVESVSLNDCWTETKSSLRVFPGIGSEKTCFIEKEPYNFDRVETKNKENLWAEYNLRYIKHNLDIMTVESQLVYDEESLTYYHATKNDPGVLPGSLFLPSPTHPSLRDNLITVMREEDIAGLIVAKTFFHLHDLNWGITDNKLIITGINQQKSLNMDNYIELMAAALGSYYSDGDGMLDFIVPLTMNDVTRMQNIYEKMKLKSLPLHKFEDVGINDMLYAQVLELYSQACSTTLDLLQEKVSEFDRDMPNYEINRILSAFADPKKAYVTPGRTLVNWDSFTKDDYSVRCVIQ